MRQLLFYITNRVDTQERIVSRPMDLQSKCDGADQDGVNAMHMPATYVIN